MKRSRIVATLFLFLSMSAFSATTLHYFQGFTNTQGGAGGAILRVTNLDAAGPGSLRAALEAKGPRMVVFEVGGIIDLNGGHLGIREPYLTIAGQTAPSPGITVIRGGISISTHDILIQHLRVRPGDAGRPKRSGFSPDGISTSAAYDVVIDHCSLTWAVDENLSASGPRDKGYEKTSRRITFSNCIIAECLHNATHEKGAHSKGSLIHDYCSDIAIFGNLYAHNVARNPYFKAFTTGVVVNNLIYNPGKVAIQMNYVVGEFKESGLTPENGRISVVGNVLQHGQDTYRNVPLVATRGDAYLEDNHAFLKDGTPTAKTDGKIVVLDEKPVWPETMSPLPASETVAHILAHVGARPKDRDPIDTRILKEFQEGKGRIIDSQDEVGGYPEHAPTKRALAIPEENIQAWLDDMAAALE